MPVDLKEASVTVGTVIKFQYDLPTNSSEYTSRIYGFANTVSRDMHDGTKENEEEENDIDSDSSRNVDIENDLDMTANDNDTLVDINFGERRRKRSLYYAEGELINDIEKSGTNGELPLEEAIRRQELLDQKNINEEGIEPQRMNRWDYYKIIEHMIERCV